MKKGKTYLMVDPEADSGRMLDLHRLILRRVRVELVRVHYLSLRKRYEVKYNGQIYRTGRIFPTKDAA